MASRTTNFLTPVAKVLQEPWVVEGSISQLLVMLFGKPKPKEQKIGVTMHHPLIDLLGGAVVSSRLVSLAERRGAEWERGR